MEDEGNNGYKNDDFIIWMRVAAFPTFKNLYRRLSRTNEFADGLPAGNYVLHISYSILSLQVCLTLAGRMQALAYPSCYLEHVSA